MSPSEKKKSPLKQKKKTGLGQKRISNNRSFFFFFHFGPRENAQSERKKLKKILEVSHRRPLEYCDGAMQYCSIAILYYNNTTIQH